MTEAMVDDALVEKVARAMADADCAGLRRSGIQAELKHWRSFEHEARAAIAIAYPAGVAAGREEAAAHLEAEAEEYRSLQVNAALIGESKYRKGQKDACLIQATAIRQRGE